MRKPQESKLLADVVVVVFRLESCPLPSSCKAAPGASEKSSGMNGPSASCRRSSPPPWDPKVTTLGNGAPATQLVMLSSASRPTCDEYFSVASAKPVRPVQSPGGHDSKLQSMLYRRLSGLSEVLSVRRRVARVEIGARCRCGGRNLWRCCGSIGRSRSRRRLAREAAEGLRIYL